MKAIKDIRLKSYNYKNDGYYFVTAICDQRKNYFIGKENLVESELKNLSGALQGFQIDFFIIMPNHVHIIFVLKDSQLALSEIVRRFKAKVTYTLKQKVWQPNFYEHVIRNEKALGKIREYILNNPQEHIFKFKQFYI